MPHGFGSTLRSRSAAGARPPRLSAESSRRTRLRLGTVRSSLDPLLSTVGAAMSDWEKHQPRHRRWSETIRVSVRSPAEIEEFTVRQVGANAHTLSSLRKIAFTLLSNLSVIRYCVCVCAYVRVYVQLKRGLAGHLGVPAERLVLIHSGQVVRESEILSHLQRQDGTVRLCMIQR